VIRGELEGRHAETVPQGRRAAGARYCGEEERASWGVANGTVAVLEPTARDHAEGRPRFTATAEASTSRRMDGGASSVPVQEAARRRGDRRQDQLVRRPPSHPIHDTRRMDAGTDRQPSVRTDTRGAAGDCDPLPHDIRDHRAHTDSSPRLDEGLGVDSRDVVLRILGFRNSPGRHRLLCVQLRDLRRFLGRPLCVREDGLSRTSRWKHDHRGTRQTNHGNG
jgi:hypothetical protein